MESAIRIRTRRDSPNRAWTTGLSSWTLNNDGVADPSEPTTLTNASGDYSFISLPAGDYEVTEVLPGGWECIADFDSRQTVAVVAGNDSIAGDFANFTILNGSIRGTVWNDLNRNGVRDDGSVRRVHAIRALAGWTVFLDLNRNRVADPRSRRRSPDPDGDYSFADLQVGDYEVQEILPSGWEVAPTFSDSQTVTVFSGTESLAPDFANFNLAAAAPARSAARSGTISMATACATSTGLGGAFTDPGLAGWTVFVDLNSNGVREAE